jgi:hypothetical protein
MTAADSAIGQTDPQADALAFLETVGAFCPGECARRIDTHAAYVFLVGDRAWKMKRAVQFPYLDFSTVERRHEALSTELSLNQRTAPGLYLALHPLCRTETGAFRIDGKGETVDWLLEMRRFPDDALLEHVAERGELGDDLVLALADTIAAFHAASAPSLRSDGHLAIEAVIGGNRDSLARYGHLFASTDVDRLVERQQGMARQWSKLLDTRGARGRVRHGHGDLHLANIAVIDTEPILFDCLEFDEALATNDVLYDLAFLLMDLWGRGLRPQANGLFNRYLDMSPEDEDGLPLLPLFLSMRATIRAHALAAQCAGGEDPCPIARRARDYFSLANDLLESPAPRLVAIGGLSGSGKSTIARMIAADIGRAPGARILRSDVLRKRMAGLRPEQPLARSAYARTASHDVYCELGRLAAQAIHGGHAVIADGVFADPAERRAIGDVAAGATTFTGIWLEAPCSALQARIDARKNDASDADLAVARLQESYEIGDLGHWHRVAAAGAREDVASTVARIVLQR